MIAPKNFSSEPLEIFLYLMDHTIDTFGFDPIDLPHGKDLSLPRDWWSVWRAEVIVTDPEGVLNIVLFTNETTLYSFLCGDTFEDFDAIVESFKASFLNCLHDKGVLLPSECAINVTPMQGEPQDSSDDAWWVVEAAKKHLTDIKADPVETEAHINNGPTSEVGGNSPTYFLHHELNRKTPWDAPLKAPLELKEIEDPDEDVPF